MITCEFTGLPGSGKTYLMNQLTEDKRFLHYDDALVLSLDRTWWGGLLKYFITHNYRWRLYKKIYDYFLVNFYYKKFAANYSNLISLVELALIDEEQHFAEQRFKWFKQIAGQYWLFASLLPGNQVVCFDEGLIHRVYNLYLRPGKAVDYSQVAGYLDKLPPLDMLVALNIDVATALARLKERRLPQILVNLTENEIEDYLKSAAELNAFVVKYLSQNSAIKVFPDLNSLKNSR